MIYQTESQTQISNLDKFGENPNFLIFCHFGQIGVEYLALSLKPFATLENRL